MENKYQLPTFEKYSNFMNNLKDPIQNDLLKTIYILKNKNRPSNDEELMSIDNGICSILNNYIGHNADIQHAAILHYTFRGNELPIDDIQKKFPESVINIIKELTPDNENIKYNGETKYYMTRIPNYSDEAIVIKLAEMLYNLENKKCMCDINDYALQTKLLISKMSKNIKSRDTFSAKYPNIKYLIHDISKITENTIK